MTPMRIGLLSDTHVPYRAPEISPAVLAALRGVDLILHAGDVDEPWALDPLRELAPVHAVRGNLHLLDGSGGGRSLPESITVDAGGHRIAVTHGHQLGPLITGLWKARSAWRGLRGRGNFPAYTEAIVQSLLRRFPQADVIVFGHTHIFYTTRRDGVLVVNPGAAMATSYFNAPDAPSVAHLVLTPGQPPKIERIPIPPQN
ncbi:MAG: metallophosphoesterase family protein [Anaerolineales bacterium]